MRITRKLSCMISATSCILSLLSCDFSTEPEESDSAIDPFSNGRNERNMIVAISDIHLGADLNYAEIKNNLGALEEFLKQLKESPDVKELVIAGDLLDEWFVPATIDTYQGKDQADFVQRIKATNKDVFDVLNGIIQEGKILVTYVPGNHDLTITAANVELILPGINQARDAEQGLGTYSPADHPTIAIEHGHRYNFFCAPDPFSNQDIAPGTISPPGYFFTRIGALHVAQKKPLPGDNINAVTPNSNGDESQQLLYAYYQMWNWSVNYLTIQNKFDEKIIITNVDGFTNTYSVNDLVPYQTTPGGEIDVNLFKGIQDNWAKRQEHNHVAVNIPVKQAILGSTESKESDDQAKNQYFLNPNSNKRIVIFGHTHEAKIEASNNVHGQKCIYANSGTWIDRENASTMNFIVITPQNNDPASQTTVKLYNYRNEVVTEMAEDSIRL